MIIVELWDMSESEFQKLDNEQKQADLRYF